MIGYDHDAGYRYRLLNSSESQMSITIELIQDLEVQVRSAAKREGVAPSAYVANVLRRHLQEQSVPRAESESDLLGQINVGLSGKEWQRYNDLRARLADATLQPDEQEELIAFSDRIEAANVRRVAALIRLAEMRSTTVDELIDQLGIRPPVYA